MLTRAIPDTIPTRKEPTQNFQNQFNLPRVQRPAIFYNVEQGARGAFVLCQSWMAGYSEARIFGRKILAEKKLQDVIFFSGVLATF